jgi:hypothetical protein
MSGFEPNVGIGAMKFCDWPSNFGIGAYSNVRIGAKNFFFDWSLEMS